MYSSIETVGFEKLWWDAVRCDMIIRVVSGALVGNGAGRVRYIRVILRSNSYLW